MRSPSSADGGSPRVISSFELRGVHTGPAESPVLNGLSLDLPCEGVTVLAGPSGSGKTSLIRLLNRLDDPTAGTVRWNEVALHDIDPVALRRRVGMVFQRPPIFPGTVLDNLAVADRTIDRARAVESLAAVGLAADLVDRVAVDLSGGEAQRLCFARALLTRPEVLLADEPTASLDGAARSHVETLAEQLAADGMPIVWVSHDVAQLRRLADHVVVLVGGAVAASGSLERLDQHDDPHIRELVGAP